MRYYFLIAALIAGVAQADPLFELYVGASWTYDVEVEDGEGYRVVNAIHDKHQVGDIDWYQLEEYGDIFWVANTEQGQVEAFSESEIYLESLDHEDVEKLLIFKFPAEPGESWAGAYGDVITYQGKKTRTVPAGTFACHSYFIDLGDGSYSKSCIAPDVGVVHNESVDAGAREISRLVSHE